MPSWSEPARTVEQAEGTPAAVARARKLLALLLAQRAEARPETAEPDPGTESRDDA